MNAKNKSDIATLLVVADFHINSTTGLIKPVVHLDDGGTYHASRTQRWLYECYMDIVDIFSELPGRKITAFNGDLVELDTKKRKVQLISINKADILSMAIDTLEPLFNVTDTAIVMRGTIAHSGKGSWAEEDIAKDFDNVLRRNHTASWWHFRGQIAGLRTDLAHHASMGYMPWTEKNAANKIASIAMFRYAQMEQPPPGLIVRSHNHRIADSGKNYLPILAICTPALTAPDEYLYRIGRENTMADIGAAYFVIENGEIKEWDFMLYKPKASRIWALKV